MRLLLGRAALVTGLLAPLAACGHHSNSAPVTAPVSWADVWVNGWTGSAQGPNAYAHETQGASLYTLWSGDSNSNNQYSNLSDCSFFGTATLKRSYGWTDAGLAAWLCQGNCPVGHPQAVHYHDAIVGLSHFSSITHVNSIATGDLIALKYYDVTTDTGHFMWADAAPASYCPSCSPIEWTISIIDSSTSYHGTADTRYIGTTCSTNVDCSATAYSTCDPTTLKCSYTGIGRGTLRLYADSSGTILGYSWSTASNSTRYLNSDVPLNRHIVVGRYDGSSGQ